MPSKPKSARHNSRRSTGVRHTAERYRRRNSAFSLRMYASSWGENLGRSARHSLTSGPALWRVQYHNCPVFSPPFLIFLLTYIVHDAIIKPWKGGEHHEQETQTKRADAQGHCRACHQSSDCPRRTDNSHQVLSINPPGRKPRHP